MLLFPSEEQWAVRFAIAGEWPCQDLSVFLHETNDVYRRLNSVFVLRKVLDGEASSNRSLEEKNQGKDADFSWQHQHFDPPTFPDGSAGTDVPPYSKLIELANTLVAPLHVDAITYASPGWIQLIGNWNPLKVLADSVSGLDPLPRAGQVVAGQHSIEQIVGGCCCFVLVQGSVRAGRRRIFPGRGRRCG